MIAFSAEAEPARAYLLRAYNDLDIFVEDSKCQNMYVRLFNRVLRPKGKRITHVFPLHGRGNVLSACAADQGGRSRRRLYLIDGDEDLLLQVALPALEHLYRLRVYCAENLLLSEHAAVTIGTECDTEARWHDVAVALAIRPLIEGAVADLLPLFVVYAVVRRIGLKVETVGYPVQRLLRDALDPSSLSRRLVRSRIISLVGAVRSAVPRATYRAARNSIVEGLARSTGDRSCYISGKSYLFPLIHLQLRRIAKLNDTQDRLKVRLAEHCELDIDSGLEAALHRAAGVIR